MYEQAPQPVVVVAVGGCPCTGIIFRDSYNWDGPPGAYIPIDAYVPGCPPKPEAIISALMKVVEKLRARGRMWRRHRRSPGDRRPPRAELAEAVKI